jgi:hypothetical protein
MRPAIEVPRADADEDGDDDDGKGDGQVLDPKHGQSLLMAGLAIV